MGGDTTERDGSDRTSARVRPAGQAAREAALNAAVGALQWGALTVGRAGPLRRAIVGRYERRLHAQYGRQMAAGPNPRIVEQKRDIALAILHTMDRAMEYGLLGAATMRGVLNIITREILFPQFGQDARRSFQAQHHSIPPGLLAISPIKACNLRCQGCFTDSGPAREKLEWDVFSRIVRDARELWGAHFFILAGGEPFLYKDQGHRMIDIAEQHRDCFFLLFTNATLIDDAIARRLGALGNVTPAVSVEGLRETTDARRGAGVFDRVVQAMGLLRREHVPFGLSITATSHNYREIMSDEFIDFFYGQMQAMYGWIFQYMPIGRAISIAMMPTPEQRLWMLDRMWQIVAEKHYFLADFWSSGILTDGCLSAGGRGGYLYIDWNGAITPCAFVPYSPLNIHDVYAGGGSLNDVWAHPFFADLRAWQQQYNPGMGLPGPHPRGNLLTPCPYRDHHAQFMEILRRHEPDPTDENAEAALLDPEYHEGMVRFDRELAALADPIWQREYL
ncbi:MAG TPA: radical SAM protein [Anaerolineae bacterium]|nr:radical SAM protein [Anaerolineae bacterium]HOQ98321.1 radical SAM protein [Anaerolineae bacterium]HPL27873.1 radical SAM protein [Anaerolineae bacterium]